MDSFFLMPDDSPCILLLYKKALKNTRVSNGANDTRKESLI